MNRVARWTAFALVALAFGPLWYELVAQLYTSLFTRMPPSAIFSLEPRRPQGLAACSLASLLAALALHRRIARARGIDAAFLGGGLLLCGALLTPLLWWLIELGLDALAFGPSGLGEDALVVVVYAPLLLAVSGLAWTALIVWAAWPLAALQVWLLGRVVTRP